MNGMVGVISYGLGTILGLAFIAWLVIAIIHDVTQKKHTVLRNYPVIGRLRFFFEDLGEYFRQYFFAGDRDEMPFNRATRGWVYKEAKNEGGIIALVPPTICASRATYSLSIIPTRCSKKTGCPRHRY